MKLVNNVSVVRGSSMYAIIIKTPNGDAKLTLTTLKNIVKLNNHLHKKENSTYPYDAGRKLNTFIYEELENE